MSAVSTLSEHSGPDYKALWKNFTSTYRKGKLTESPEEEAARFRTFTKNVDYIYETNAAGPKYEVAINQFADLDVSEMVKTHMGYKPKHIWGSLPHLGVHSYSGKALPHSVDWTTEGAVTLVKNQGRCGSCWAFSTIGSLEGAWALTTGNLTSMSEQQLVDCSKGNNGCGGGGMELGFEFEEGVAVCTEDTYPYVAADGICKQHNCIAAIAKGGVVGYRTVEAGSMESLMSAVKQQPVSVAIEADQMSFQFYKGGVLTGLCGSKLDHGVLLGATALPPMEQTFGK